MRTPRTRTSRWAPALAGLALLALTACQPARSPAPVAPAPSNGAERTTLALQAAEVDDGLLAADLVYARGAGQIGPRVAEVTLAYPAAVMAFQQALPGDSLATTGKRLVVQDRGGTLRVVFFATDNLAPVDSGTLARLAFRRVGPGTASLAFAGEPGVFAPEEASRGLLFGPAVTLAEE